MKAKPLQLWAGASIALMLIGSFGPWAKAPFASVGGTDGSNDGWLVVLLAVASAGLLYLRVKRGSSWPALVAALAGIGATAITISDRGNVSGSEFADAGLVQVGWGLNLAMIASISLVVVSLVFLRRPASVGSDNSSPEV